MASKDNPDRPIWLVCIVFAVLGYALYFAALLLPTPEWGRELIEYFATSVKALDTAERVATLKGNDPFSAQVVILYCAWGSVVLTGWGLYAWAFNKQVRQASWLRYQALPSNKRPSQLRIFIAVFTLIIAVVPCWYIFFLSGGLSNTWRDAAMFSSSMHSATFLIASSATLALFIPCAIVMTHVAFFKKPQI